MVRPTLTASEERSQRARIAALARWSRENPKPTAERGQRGLLDKFRREIKAEQPDVTEPELSRRADARRREHMARMAYASAKAAKLRAAKRAAGCDICAADGGDVSW